MRFARKQAYFLTNLTQLHSFLFFTHAQNPKFRPIFDLSLWLSFFPLPFFLY